MKHWMSLAVALSLLPTLLWAAPGQDNIYEENLYNEFHSILSSNFTKKDGIYGLTHKEQKLFVDALWDLVDEEKNQEAIAALYKINYFYYHLIERLRIEILRIKNDKSHSLPYDLIEEVKNTLVKPVAKKRLIYIISSYEEDLVNSGHNDLIELAKKHAEYFDIVNDEKITNNIVADLFYETPDSSTYMNGSYANSVKIFMFCRENRLYPCLMVMKDVHGQTVRNDDGTLWTHPALASSARGLPSHVRNGNTPEGILTIDSVMPKADQWISFGKYRRLILNFIPKSTNESLMKSLIPESSQNAKWWKPAVVSRDIGRNLLRVHGTGKINPDPSAPFYPFMRTSGCIAQRENTYEGVTFKDQRILLDDIMKAMELEPNYANEEKIKGFLYIMNLDNENTPVTEHDLASRGIQ